jgi:regulatory protein
MKSASRPAGFNAATRRSSRKPLDPLTAAVRLLARGDRSAYQVTAFLSSQGYSQPVIRATRRTLERLGYLNDEATALRLAEAQLLRRPMARRALYDLLAAREFPHTVVDRAIRQAYHNDTEESVAARFLRSLPVRFTGPAREARRRAALLASRGFSEDLIEALLGSALADQGQS